MLGPGPNEIAWYAAGGGRAYFEPVPAWQASAGGSFLGAGRGVPDVSLDADPNSGYSVIVAGQETIIGGTSASAPAWQGIWARTQSAKGGNLGFAGPVIYGRARQRLPRHHDRDDRLLRGHPGLGLHERPRHAGHHGLRRGSLTHADADRAPGAVGGPSVHRARASVSACAILAPPIAGS